LAYKVYCPECRTVEMAKNVTEAKYLIAQHKLPNGRPCLEAQWKRVS
jgi:hypothetical protein